MNLTSDVTPSAGQQWLEQLLALMAINTQVMGQKVGDNHDWLEIDSQPLEPEHSQALIGKNGATLDAIQFLLNTQMNLESELQEQAYTVEHASYRSQRHTELVAMAQQAVAAVRATGQEFVFEPLRSSAERRQLHMMLGGEVDLHTFSRGKEPDRYLVLSPKGNTEEPDEESRS